MSRYREAPIGVLDTVTGYLVTPKDGAAWQAYQRWVASGNAPDPAPAPAPLPLSERRARHKQHARGEAQRSAIRGVAHLNTRFVFSTSDYALQVLVAVLATNNVPTGFGWRDENGVFVPLNIAQVRALVEAYAEREFARMQNLWALEDSINSSSNPEAVDVTTGWPT